MTTGDETSSAIATVPRAPARGRAWIWPLLLFAAFAGWWWVFTHLNLLSLWFTYDVLHFPGEPADLNAVSSCCEPVDFTGPTGGLVRQGRALAFLLYELPHVFLLLAAVVFVMGVIRSFFSPARTRRVLAGRRAGFGTVLGAGLGVLTPFCSCSAVPLFIGFLTAGAPLGGAVAFLVAAPLVNEVALALLATTPRFGPIFAAGYLGIGLTIAILTGWIVERLGLRRFIEPWALEIAAREMPEDTALDPAGRLRAGLDAVREVVSRVWPYVLGGLVAGAVLHVYVSQAAMIALLGEWHWWSVPLAVLLGVPMYASPAGIIPVVEALLGKGVPLGTVLAFMMAVIGLSLPEFILLRRVLKPPFLLLFAGVVAAGILMVGLAFNLAAR